VSSYILSIDQGTTSSRAILFDENFNAAFVSQKEFKQYYPSSGLVEHDAEEIWDTVIATCRDVIALSGGETRKIAAIGITNQRETSVIWDRKTSKPIHKAIVWQDRRTADTCSSLKDDGLEKLVSKKTGLLLDPYFSGTKVAWMLDNVEGARAAAENGDLAFGTIDTFLLWRLTNGRVHKTDATNAARTLLFNIRDMVWDQDLLKILNVPASMLPEVTDCAHEFGHSAAELFGAEIPILGMAGDQQAATIGQACFDAGMMKSTYGTGCFALMNTGSDFIKSDNRLLTTVAYQLNGQPTYALEGSIFIAGAAVQWLRDGIGTIKDAAETGPMAADADPGQDVILVPAFAGLGAPYWEPEVRGAIFGLSRGTGPNELSKAALEAVCYQTKDLVQAMHKDWGTAADIAVRVDGGMVVSDWTMQFLADILDAPIDRPVIPETTALGAAWLAGMKSGIWPDQQGFAKEWRLDRRFIPNMKDELRKQKYHAWQAAVQAAISEQRMRSGSR
jgi:glycerol kinase